MATITPHDPNGPKRPGQKEMKLPGGTIRYRDTAPDAKYKPADDPNNPYSNNKYRIEGISKIWEQLRPCRKEVYNHSYNKYKLAGLAEEKKNFLVTKYMLGLNDISHSLDPTTGNWDWPECFCFTATDVLCNPLMNKILMELHSNRGSFVTSYNVEHGGGSNFTGSWHTSSVLGHWGLNTGYHYTRACKLINWMQAVDRRNKIPMIPGFYMKGYNGNFHLNACNNWVYKGSGGGNYKVRFCPLGCEKDLCAVKEMEFNIEIGDEVAYIDYTGPASGIEYKAYWFDKFLFNTYTGPSWDKVTEHADVTGYALHDVKPWMYAGSSLDCCEPNPNMEGRQFCLEDPGVVIGPAYPNCEGGHWISSTFHLDAEPINVRSGNPQLQFFTKNMCDKKAKCGSGYQCDSRGFQTWWPCGGVFVTFRRSIDGASITGWGFPDLDLTTSGSHPCWTNWAQVLDGVDEIEVLVRNSTAWGCCTCTGICKITVNDKLWTGEKSDVRCEDDK